MNLLLRELLMQDESLSPSDKAIVAFFEIIAFALGWAGVDRLLAGTSLLIVISIFAATILTSYTGFKWPHIKQRVGPRVASTVDRIARSRLYRWFVARLMVIALQ